MCAADAAVNEWSRHRPLGIPHRSKCPFAIARLFTIESSSKLILPDEIQRVDAVLHLFVHFTMAFPLFMHIVLLIPFTLCESMDVGAFLTPAVKSLLCPVLQRIISCYFLCD